MMKYILLLTLFILSMLSVSKTVAESMDVKLGPGINAPGWGNKYLEPLTVEEYSLISRAGFKSVRQPILPSFMLRQGCKVRHEVVQRIERTGKVAERFGLTFIVDLHALRESGEVLAANKPGGCLMSIWRQLAISLKGEGKNIVFEILNEPPVSDLNHWWQVQMAVVKAIKKIDNTRIVLVSSGNYDTARSLVKMVPYSIPGVIYVFHDYRPMRFTHQGVGRWKASAGTVWGFNRVKNGSSKVASSSFPEVTAVKVWARRYGVQVICGEFGVLGTHGTPSLSRMEYLHDITSKLESANIPWIVWQFVGAFGIAKRSRTGVTEFQPGVLHALGLKFNRTQN